MDNINSFFSTASLLLKIYLRREDENVSFGELTYNDEGFNLDYFSSKLQLSSVQFKAIDKHLIKIALNIGAYEKINCNKVEALKLVANDQYQKTLINKSFFKTYIFYKFEKFNIVLWHQDLVLENFKDLKVINLLTIGGVYWEGDQNNKQLVRVSGCGFKSHELLDQHLQVMAEHRERDHRKIGKTLDLFTFDILAGQGMPIWLPKGTVIKNLIGDYVHQCQERYGFNFVSTPVLGSLNLYKLSGHYSHYNEDMFPPIELEDEAMMLRPMTCPHHCLIYLHKPRSYRDLPLRFSEDSILHRYESSGGLTGLERVRAMTLLDNHIFCRPDQIEDEITNAYNIVHEVAATFNLKFERVDLALHDASNKEKFIDDSKMWATSEAQLEKALNKLNIKYTKQVGDAAFYGPKIDFQCKTALNKIITCSTIQLDFSLPNKFKTIFMDQNQKETKCVIIHLGIIGTYERFIATLLEQTKGVLPLWLAPVQVQLIPVVCEKHKTACETLQKKLKAANIRCEIDDRDERLSKRIRDSQLNKIPLQIVIGDKEAENLNKINYRKYGSEDIISISLQNFIKMLEKVKTEHI